MRFVRRLAPLVLGLALVLLAALPAGPAGAAVSIPLLEEKAKDYEQRLTAKTQAGTDVNALVAKSIALRKSGDLKGLVETLETIAGTQPASQPVWLALALAWDQYQPTADEAVAAAYAAYAKSTNEQQSIDALNELSLILRKRLDADASPRDPAGVARLSQSINWSWNVYGELFALLKKDAEKRDFLRDAQNLPTDGAFSIESLGVQWQSSDKAVAGCFLFSHALKEDPAAHKPFVTVSESAGQGQPGTEIAVEITVKDKLLCAHGLEHGKYYSFTFKEGLPAENGAPLAVTKVREAFAPDLPPTISFRSAAFIVPRGGAKVVPMHTVNVDRVALELIRVSDRSIHRQIALDLIGHTLRSDKLQELQKDFGERIWTGEKAVTGPRNTPVVTNLPLFDLLEERKAWIGQEPIEGAEPETPPAEAAASGPGNAGDAFTRGAFYRDPASSQAAGSPVWEPGVYALIAGQPQDAEADAYGDKPVQWFVFTDIGLTYYRSSEKLYVIARSLQSGAALEGVRVQLVAANNRVLDEGMTHEHGVAEFEGRLAEGSSGNRLVAILAYADDANDFSYVDFQHDGFDLSHHGIAGREPPKLYDAFVYTDRGIYRPTPDEPISVTVALRDADGRLAKVHTPLRLVMTASTGQSLAERQIDPAELEASQGVVGVKLQLPETAPLGAAKIEIYLGQLEQPIGSATVQIAHFKPDRARINLVDRDAWQSALADWTLKLAGKAKVQYLYGIKAGQDAAEDAPASRLASEMEITLERADTPFEGCYTTFRFGNEDESFPSYLVRKQVGATGDDGSLPFDLSLPSIPHTSLPLHANVKLTVLDEAGPVATRLTSLPVARPGPMIGLRRTAKPVADGRYEVSFDIAALEGKAPAAAGSKLAYKLYRERTEFLWFKSSQYSQAWEYKPDTVRTVVGEGAIDIGAATVIDCEEANAAIAKTELPVGDYVMEVSGEGGAKALQHFTLGVSSAGDARPEPDRLILRAAGAEGALSAPGTTPDLNFKPGDEAAFALETPFDGRVLLSVVQSGRVEAWFEADTKDRTASFKIPVPEVWSGQAFYALATVFRSGADGTETKGPSRAIGLLHFTVDRAKRKLKLSLEGTPFKITPSSSLQMRLTAEQSDGTPLNGKAFLAAYAVDEGLVNMTEHPLPNPYSYFYGQRRLALSISDSYGRLLLTSAAGSDQGGDTNLFVPKVLSNNYLSEAIVSAYTPPVEVEFRNGIAYKGDTPFINLDASFKEFTGTVRLAAIVWTADGFGVESRDVVVRNTVVARLGLPRFVAPGDKPLIPLTIENLEAAEGDFQVQLTVPNLQAVTVPGDPSVDTTNPEQLSIHLKPRERRIAWLELDIPDTVRANSPLPFLVHVTGANEANPVDIEQSRSVTARRPVPPETVLVASKTIAPGQKLKLEPGLLPKTLKGKYASYEVQARFSNSPLLLSAAEPPGELAAAVKTVERLTASGLLLLQQSGDSGPPEALAGLAQDLVALQTPDGSFAPYQRQRPTSAEETANEVILSVRRGNDALWQTALAADFLRLLNGKPAAVTEPLKRSLTYLQTDLRRQIGYWQSGTPENATALPAAPGEYVDKAQFWDDVPGMQDDQKDTASGSSETPPCEDDGIAYAAYVLAKLNAITDAELASTATMCRAVESPLTQVVLAAALRAFGRNDSDVKAVLASFSQQYDSQAGTGQAGTGETGGGEAAQPNDRRTEDAAMMLAFLTIAKADDAQVQKVLAAMRKSHKDNLPLSAETQAWLARAVIEPEGAGGAPAQPISVKIDPARVGDTDIVANTNPVSIATRFLSAKELADGKLVAANTGKAPVALNLFVRGVPKKAAANDPTQQLGIRQRLFDVSGKEITGAPALKQNDLVFVVIEGWQGTPPADAPEGGPGTAPGDGSLESAGEPPQPGTPVNGESGGDRRMLVIGYLPTGLEIVKGDAYQEIGVAGSEAGLSSKIPAPAGSLDHLEARDDKLVAVVTPKTGEGGSQFRIAYVARATTAGEFTVPPAQAEDYDAPELAAVSEAAPALKVEALQ